MTIDLSAITDMLAQDVREAVAEGQEVEEAIWEAVDGTEYVIYTNMAAEVVAAATYDDREGAYAEMISDMGAAPDTYADVLTRTSYYILAARVREAVRDIDAED